MQERAYLLLVQLMNVLVFLVDYGATTEISKDVADIIMELLQNGTYTCICFLLHEILIIRYRIQTMCYHCQSANKEIVCNISITKLIILLLI